MLQCADDCLSCNDCITWELYVAILGLNMSYVNGYAVGDLCPSSPNSVLMSFMLMVVG